MLRLVMTAFTVVSISACGPDGRVASGRYRGSGQLDGATLIVDLSSKSGSLTLAGASTPIALTLGATTVVSVCPGNIGSRSAESVAVRSPDPLVAGDVSLPGAQLVGGCSSSDTNVDLTTSAGAPRIRFTPAQ